MEFGGAHNGLQYNAMHTMEGGGIVCSFARLHSDAPTWTHNSAPTWTHNSDAPTWTHNSDAPTSHRAAMADCSILLRHHPCSFVRMMSLAVLKSSVPFQCSGPTIIAFSESVKNGKVDLLHCGDCLIV